MNIYQLNSLAARETGCTRNTSTGEIRDYLGNEISGCDECCGCEFGHGRAQEYGGVISGTRILMRGKSVHLEWDCPECGKPVREETLPISAIDDAQEIAKDPICFSCRKKNQERRT